MSASREWIDQALARLERLEADRGRLQEALAEAERRLARLATGVAENDTLLDDLEEQTGGLAVLERALDERRSEVTARRERLWQALQKIQRERDALRADEQRLATDERAFAQRRGDVPSRHAAADAERRRLERDLAAATRTRDDLHSEIEVLDREMHRTTRALENAAQADETDRPADVLEILEAEAVEVAPMRPPLRLVAPPPVPATRVPSPLPTAGPVAAAAIEDDDAPDEDTAVRRRPSAPPPGEIASVPSVPAIDRAPNTLPN